MAIFLDTGFYMGLVDPKDQYYQRSNDLLKELLEGLHGRVYTSIFIMMETSTLTAIRTIDHEKILKEVQNLFLGTNQIATILPLNNRILDETWNIFLKINKTSVKDVVSFIDCANISICKYRNIKKILAYDKHFDGWMTRIF